MSDLQAINCDADLEKALARIEEIFFAEEGSDEERELENLVSKVRAYESARYERKMPEPIEAIKFMMEQGDYLPEDLVCGAVSHSERLDVLAGTRSLSYEMASSLSDQLAIPLNILLPEVMQSAEKAGQGEGVDLPAVGTRPD